MREPTLRTICRALTYINKESTIVVNALEAGIVGQEDLNQDDLNSLAAFKDALRGYLDNIEQPLQACIERNRFSIKGNIPPWGGAGC